MAIWDGLRAFLERLRFGSLLDAFRPETAPETSVAFTIAIIALGAKLARADGRVTEDERRAFSEVFRVPAEHAADVGRFFHIAQQDPAGYEAYARRIARLFAGRRDLLEDALDGLFHIAEIDHKLHPAEIEHLTEVGRIFGLEDETLRRMKMRHDCGGEPCPHTILGVRPGAAMEEVRAAWAALAREHHPDRLIARGLPAEALSIAADRLARVNAAYETLKRRSLETAR